MATLHNALGEGGKRLTILSLLGPAVPDGAALARDRELSLRDAIDEIFRMAGADGQASVVLEIETFGADKPDFTKQENVSLKELAERLYGSFGADGDSASVLRILRPGDDPLGGLSQLEESAEDGENPNGLVGVWRRLREAVHHLFGGSAADGYPPTVLSLLVDTSTTRPSADGLNGAKA